MTPNLCIELHAVDEMVGLAMRFRHIEGWLGDHEGYLLFRLARDAEGAGAIVEIGSWMGRSTAFSLHNLPPWLETDAR